MSKCAMMGIIDNDTNRTKFKINSFTGESIKIKNNDVSWMILILADFELKTVNSK